MGAGEKVTDGRPAEVAHGDIDLSTVGAVLADPSRCRMLFALDDGRRLPAGRLAEEAGVSPSTASAHLRKLAAAGLVTDERHGRHRYYRLAGPAVAALIESLTAIAPRRPVRSLRDGTRAHRLRLARSCYDHLAGRLGVAVMGRLLSEGHLAGHDGTVDPDRLTGALSGGGDDTNYSIPPGGVEFFQELGIADPGRLTVRCCVDWSEQRHHLSGQLGRALLQGFLRNGWLRRGSADRAITVTDAGVRGLRDRFDIDFAAMR